MQIANSFFCVQKAGRGNKKKMVIFIVVIYCLTLTASKHGLTFSLES